MKDGEKNRNIRIVSSGILSPLRKWGTKWSLWPCHFLTSCCGVELAHSGASGYDMERLGTLNMGISRQTNFIIVEGTITRKMARALRIVWEQMPDPKFVNIIGACGQRGGIFWNSYNITYPHDIVPVDFFIPGCPVTPEGLMRGVRAVQRKIEGRDETTVKFDKVELPSLPPEERKEYRVPTTPKIYAPTPTIRVDVPSDVDWNYGEGLVQELKTLLNGLYESITITDKNRIAIRTTSENVVEVAKKLSEEMNVDHVKNVNVIDVPHERKYIVEYMVSSYTKELMPVIISIFAEIRREEEAKFPSFSTLWESADYTEREMHDFFGVRFEGNEGIDSKFLLAPDTPDFPLRKDFKLEEERYVIEKGIPLTLPIKPPHYTPPSTSEMESLSMPVSEEIFEESEKRDGFVAFIGPHHSGSGHLRWVVRMKGDIIEDIIPDPGYVHRSMEKLAENRLYVQNIPLFERACIAEPINLNLGYVRTIEKALGLDVPERASYIRTLMAELSRIGCFLYDAGIFSLFTGHSTGYMYSFAVREMILEAIVGMTGSRCSPSFLIPGGIRRDISDDMLRLVENLTSAIHKRLKKFEDIFVYNPVLVSRAKEVGVLTRQEAINYGIVGPFLRASSVEYDTRKVEPYEVYDRLEWDMPVADEGDCLMRFLLRLEEVMQSLKIIGQVVDALKEIPKGNVISEEILGDYKEVSDDIRGYLYRVYGNLVLPRGEWTTLTEAARGTLLYSIISDGESNVPYRVRIVTPSWTNLRGIVEAARGERLADFWTIFGSFGYFPPEADR